MRSSTFIFLAWKLLLPKDALTALISSCTQTSKVSPNMFYSATCENTILNKGCQQTMMAQKSDTLLVASDLGSSTGLTESSSISSRERCVGNVLILIPSEGLADTCRCKFGSRSPVGNPTGKSGSFLRKFNIQ